ncbi:STAS domain-containing protein [Mycobacterium sp. WMMD1722]|uniref:STAS domain-containing protein n=1 Tax=Mycobacterium sp. WMMD1722 TaxID=3404117 RepID=UPI003BF5DA3A
MSSSLIDPQPIPVPDVVIRESTRNGALVLQVSGTVDMVTGPKFHAAVESALGAAPKVLVIDLSEVTFLAAAGLHVLDVARAAAGDSTVFAVVADGPATVRPIELTGLDGVLGLYPTIDDVIERHAA